VLQKIPFEIVVNVEVKSTIGTFRELRKREKKLGKILWLVSLLTLYVPIRV
jgi:hypothetical protein